MATTKNEELIELAESLQSTHEALRGFSKLLCIAGGTSEGATLDGPGDLAYLIMKQQDALVYRLLDIAYGKNVTEEVSSE
ncbi:MULTISPECIES: hypothetical protein [Methylotuvimicrobium]|uniref:Uncharacterized protein n=1 Tax=Methylotuvimicrobium alcaliphilum (strain DSM 19304 / NCIMB 14124 / VKM B-2133 / 20Z) TaxID=1091494 RepID=G4T1F7_META2|nr:hypothetical protein [Methylotuvimicrobium alcaliphilum]CCE25702.1 protein of unknown function [Methylotuvimicrobium alcaliphilum 20Z]